jgi:hypothetical protein
MNGGEHLAMAIAIVVGWAGSIIDLVSLARCVASQGRSTQR